MPEEKYPRCDEDELLDIEAEEEAAQDYIRVIEEEDYADDPFEWF